MHSPELIALLTQYGELLDQDLSQHVIYGSPMRPMSGTWARIDGAVYVPADRAATGYHTYVVVPAPLEKTVINRFELVLISNGKDA